MLLIHVGSLLKAIFRVNFKGNIDTFKLLKTDNTPILISEEKIAWADDKEKFKYKETPGTWTDVEDGKLLLIYRTFHRMDASSGFSNIQKALG